jgi:hypothetical protein
VSSLVSKLSFDTKRANELICCIEGERSETEIQQIKMDDALLHSLMPIALMLFKDHLEYFTMFLVINQIFNRYSPIVLGWFKRVAPTRDYELHVKALKPTEYNGGGGTNRTLYNAAMNLITLHQTNDAREQEAIGGSKITFGIINSTKFNWHGALMEATVILGEKYDELRIVGKDMKIMKELIIEANSQYDDDYYIDQSGRSIYTWSHEWIANPLNVVKTRENIYLDPVNEEKIFGGIRRFLDSEDYYIKHGIPYKKSYLFYGQPGTGKSATAYALSNYFKMPLHIIKNHNLDAYIVSMISTAVPNSIFLFEEIDLGSRSATKKPKIDSESIDDTEPNTQTALTTLDNEKLARMLTILDGYIGLKKCILIFTTNYPDRLDSALTRPGRMDERFEFGLIDQARADRICMDFVGQTFPLSKPITSAALINEILLPNLTNPDRIRHLMSLDS